MKITTDVQKPAACTEPETTRYALACLQVTPNCDGVWLWSTDSRGLAVAHAEIEGEIERELVPASAFSARNNGKPKTVYIDPERHEWRNSDGKIGDMEKTDADYGRFPRADQVFPEIDTLNGLAVSFDVELLQRVCSAILRKGDRKITMHLNPSQFDGPGHNDEPGDYVAPVVIMPCGADDYGTEAENENIGLMMPITGRGKMGREQAAARIAGLKRDIEKRDKLRTAKREADAKRETVPAAE